MVVAVLVLSLAGNFLLYQRQLQRRVQVTVNGEPIRKKDFYDYLEQHYGRQATANMVRYQLIMQAAKKEGLLPDPNEIEEKMQEVRETRPNLAREMHLYPWTNNDVRETLEQEAALTNLSIKDVKATDDEIRDFFSLRRGAWDKPDKIYLKAVLAADATAANQAKQLMERINDMTVVGQQLPGKAGPIGADGTWVLRKPVGKPSADPQVNAVAKMKPGEVKIIPSANNTFLVVKLEKIVPGKKVTLEEVKDRVTRDFKLTRRTPEQEVLQKLWGEANIQTEDPKVKADIERLLFPQSADRQRTATR